MAMLAVLNDFNKLVEAMFPKNMEMTKKIRAFLETKATEMVATGNVNTLDQAKNEIRRSVVKDGMSDHFFNMFREAYGMAEPEPGDIDWEEIKAIWFKKKAPTFRAYLEENLDLLNQAPNEHKEAIRVKYNRIYGRPCPYFEAKDDALKTAPASFGGMLPDTEPTAEDTKRLGILLASVPLDVYASACGASGVVGETLHHQPYEIQKRVYGKCVEISEASMA